MLPTLVNDFTRVQTENSSIYIRVFGWRGVYRALKKQGYEALIVDPASIPVERQARRRKTGRLDVIKLVNSLLAYLRGGHAFVPTLLKGKS